MKISKTKLQQIIREEMKNVLNENVVLAAIAEITEKKPLPGMSSKQSADVFLSLLQNGVQAREIDAPRNMLELEEFYDKIWRIQNPDDETHLPAF